MLTLKAGCICKIRHVLFLCFVKYTGKGGDVMSCVSIYDCTPGRRGQRQSCSSPVYLFTTARWLAVARQVQWPGLWWWVQRGDWSCPRDQACSTAHNQPLYYCDLSTASDRRRLREVIRLLPRIVGISDCMEQVTDSPVCQGKRLTLTMNSDEEISIFYFFLRPRLRRHQRRRIFWMEVRWGTFLHTSEQTKSKKLQILQLFIFSCRIHILEIW